MWNRKTLIAAIAASAIGFIAVPASAQTVWIEVEPPAPRHEIIPKHRAGHVWQPGFWDWRNGRHVWVRGYWVKERRGMHWHPSRWERRDGRWVLERGRWDRERYAYNRGMRDRDGDGVPNRVDNRPNTYNPNQGVRRDRDGDGVPNRVDARPNNPNRY